MQFRRRLQSGSDRHCAHRLHPRDVGRRARRLQPGVDREHGRGGSGSTVLNANNPGGNSMYGGSDNPTGLTAGTTSLSCGWVLCLIWMVTFAFVKEKV